MNRITSILCLLLLSLTSVAAPATTQRKNLNLPEARRIYNTLLKPATIPVAFTYDGKDYHGLGALTLTNKTETPVAGGREAHLAFALDETTSVRMDAFLNEEFGEVEYTVWFENTGNHASKVLERVHAAVLDFSGKNPTLVSCMGDHQGQYAAYEKDLAKEKASFRSDGGRATHVVFPYFNLQHGDGGTLIAIGWAGTWQAAFEKQQAKTHFTAQSCNDFRSVVMPGEKVRTALMVFLPYKGRDVDNAFNLWRAWFVKCNMPRANAQGDPVLPFSTSCWSGDTGLPNSDGSISERFYTWKRTLDRLVYEKVDIDYRWFDAGWYFDPAGQTVMRDWWGTVGSWELDTIKWPGASFRESNEACHRVGMKTLVWFEPERVTHVPDLVKNYGYKAEWAISNGRKWRKNREIFTNDLGNPECLNWTLNRITKMMLDNEVDLFREDNNSDPGTTWPIVDSLQMASLNLPRIGITENKAIQGHYELWDRIIAFCAKHGKSTFIDNCASGGGRNDIESLRRSIPFLRSDADRTTTALRLSMSSTFNRWIPYSGSSTKESEGELEGGMAGGSDFYITRASWLPVYNLSESWTHDEILDYDRVRATYGEWKKYSHLLIKDFYVLTPWHSKTDTKGWTTFAYHDPATDEGVVVAFRQETCPDANFTAWLKFLDLKTTYRLEDEDTHTVVTLTGAQLAATGLPITLDNPKSSAVWHITRQ
ncbi:MAG: alpha-galactosidase [Muribaculaceae bacterium]|nr:alpha-galactosidase [Muribaculaceae bacterium]